MATKTASIRLEESKFQELDKKCESLNCNRNDFIKKSIENELNNSHQVQNRFADCKTCDDESHEVMNLIADKIHDSEWYALEDDDEGRPVHAEIYWDYDNDENEENLEFEKVQDKHIENTSKPIIKISQNNDGSWSGTNGVIVTELKEEKETPKITARIID